MSYTNTVLLVIILVAIGFAISTYVNRPEDPFVAQVQPTPSVIETTPTLVITSTPIVTTIIPTETPTPTSTPTTTPKPQEYVNKTVQIYYNNTGPSPDGAPKHVEYKFEIPKNITVSVGKYEFFLRDGTKTFMHFFSPYEYYLKSPYSSIVSVQSNTIKDMKRIRSKTDLGNSFYVAYVAPNSILTKALCNESEVFEAVEYPCANAITANTSGVTKPATFAAHCSVQTNYIAICDRIMKDITVERLVDGL